MGTRSITRVNEGKNKIINMYRQMDGYPSGHGKELFEFLKDIKLVNGLGGDAEKVANGAGCLAAQLVAHFKDGPGGIYLEPTTATQLNPVYEYILLVSDLSITVKVRGGSKTIFQGTVAEFGDWCIHTDD